MAVVIKSSLDSEQAQTGDGQISNSMGVAPATLLDEYAQYLAVDGSYADVGVVSQVLQFYPQLKQALIQLFSITLPSCCFSCCCMLCLAVPWTLNTASNIGLGHHIQPAIIHIILLHAHMRDKGAAELYQQAS